MEYIAMSTSTRLYLLKGDATLKKAEKEGKRNVKRRVVVVGSSDILQNIRKLLHGLPAGSAGYTYLPATVGNSEEAEFLVNVECRCLQHHQHGLRVVVCAGVVALNGTRVPAIDFGEVVFGIQNERGAYERKTIALASKPERGKEKSGEASICLPGGKYHLAVQAQA